jgi:light-regulated signal transduction histidine kinase (bacteriophytochrome)
MIEVGGKPCLLTAVLDITVEKQAQAEIEELTSLLEQRVAVRTRELAEANRSLQFLNSELEAYAYSVAHDLRAPVRVIDSYSALLGERLKGTDDAELDEFVRRIRSRTRHMNRLIDDLLRLSRLSLKPIEREWVDARIDVHGVLRELDIDSDRVRIDVGDLPPYHADPAMMRHVWTNLLSNAVKYSREAASPQVRVGFGEGAYAVSDNGVGFEPVYAGKLFQVFSRLHAEAHFEGTGIGLAIVRRVVERHGGSVFARGAVGEGATFGFSALPAKPTVK